MLLLESSPEFWAHEATIDELHAAARGIKVWTDEEAEYLDFAYMTRTARLIERTRAESKEAALLLADHIMRIAHDSKRSVLEALDRPYFARWRLLAEMLETCAERLQVPDLILARMHVKEILQQVARAGGRLGQADLATLIPNPGQRSVTLKMMEDWDLVERVPGPGNTRTVLITDLGRLAIGEPAMAAAATEATAIAPPLGKRFCESMSVASA